MIDAIQNLSIRGAPLLGLAGIYGLFISSKEAKDYHQFKASAQRIRNARPTAINLSKMIDIELARFNHVTDLKKLSESFLTDALLYETELRKESDLIAEFGSTLIRQNDTILTHCNTGSLATLGLGTALGIIKLSHTLGKNISVYFTETRPLLQGARLTSYELMKSNIPSTMIIDSSVGLLMQQKRINQVIVGADRIAKNGDTVNKIGTYMIAALAHANNIPFYVACPLSTFDTTITSGKDVVIEYRSALEISKMNLNSQMGILNPAFDMTPYQLVSGFITEKGIIKPPFGELHT